MKVWPLRFIEQRSGALLFADDAGGFFQSNERFLRRYAEGALSEADRRFLSDNGQAYGAGESHREESFAFRWAQRQFVPGEMDYIILVPTLRCNLSCGYCQVSRVNHHAIGFDWTDAVADQVIRFLDSLRSMRIKIEFQGGEPLLRLDLLHRIRDFARTRFRASEFVVCTNLQTVSDDAWSFLSDSDTSISTSLDGDPATHERQRTLDADATSAFFSNLGKALDRSGPARVSAIPTINPLKPPAPEAVIATFASYGLGSIYLRPVNYQGFARKRFGRGSEALWNAYYARFIDALVAYNLTADLPIEEYYLTHCLRRIVRAGHHGHVDLRNPNLLGRDYIVIDYDGAHF